MYNTKIGKSILTLRKRARFTQKELADKIGVTDKAVSKWERGLSYPDMSYLNKLSILLDTDVDSLLIDEKKYLSTKYVGVLYLCNNSILLNSTINKIPLINILLCYFLLVNINYIIIISSKNNIKSIELIKNEIMKSINVNIELHDVKKVSYDKFIENTLKEVKSIMLIDDLFFIYGAAFTSTLQKGMLIKDKNVVFENPNIPIKFINDATKKFVNVDFNKGYLYKRIENEKDLIELNKVFRILNEYSNHKIYDVREIARNRDLLK